MGYLKSAQTTDSAVMPIGIAQSPYDRAPQGPIGYGGYRQPFAGAQRATRAGYVTNAAGLGIWDWLSSVYKGMTDAVAEARAAPTATKTTTTKTTATKSPSSSLPAASVPGVGGVGWLLLFGLALLPGYLLLGRKKASAAPARRRRRRLRKVPVLRRRSRRSRR